MKINIKQVAFVLCGLAIVALAFFITQSGIAIAEKKQNGKKFGDWAVSCSNDTTTKAQKGKKNKKTQICVLVQQVKSTQNDKEQTVAQFEIGYFGTKKSLHLIQILPLGININAGTSIISSKKLIAPGQYTTCLNNGCRAISPISNEDLKILLSNVENSIAFMTFDGQQINVPLSSKGLKAGLKYLK